MADKKKAVVIGGGGFLGRHLCEALVARGYEVIVFDLRQTFEDSRMKFVTGNLCSASDLKAAFDGAYVVFNTASPAPSSNNKKLFYQVNVHGTEAIVQACKDSGVKRLVLTSSASVVYEGKDMKNIDEECPYAKNPLDYYTETKILQERVVLEANGSDLMTVAIRPHGIFGPRDLQLVPTVADTAKRGKMKFKIGNGENLVDFTYVENVVHAHILAGENLLPSSPVCGKAYFITNLEPVKFWDFMSDICVGLGYAPPKWCLPYWFIYYLAVLIQFVCWLISPLITINPTFSPMRVALAGTYHYYNSGRAQRDFGYKPLFTVKQGLEKTLQAYPHLRNSSK